MLSVCPCWFVYFFTKSKTFEEIAITCVTFFDSLHQMFALRGRKFTMNLIVCAIGAFAIFSIGDCDLSVATEIIFTLFFFMFCEMNESIPNHSIRKLAYFFSNNFAKSNEKCFLQN